ncbi:MAG: hypothetical protein ABI874_00290 [Chloroflexota bacterium]
MLIDLHGVIIACETSDETIQQRWAQSFSSRPQVADCAPDITFTLRLAPCVPAAPDAPPIFTQGDLLSVHQLPTNEPTNHPSTLLRTSLTIVHFPRFGQLRIALDESHVAGELVVAALDTYGVFEDVVAMGLTALLRRRHLFLIHAFAAAFPDPTHPEPVEGRGRSGGGRALLLVGDIGSGKTTTGLSLLRAGWKLLSNDSPLLSDTGQGTSGKGVVAFAYPGLLSAYDDTLNRFNELALLLRSPAPMLPSAENARHKIIFAAESVYPDVWIESAPVGAMVFPRVAHLPTHRVTRLSQADALRRLLPHAIDRWDTALIPEHLALLKTLVANAPAYQLELGENVETLPDVLGELLAGN